MVVQRIDRNLCLGCRICTLCCPEDVFRFDEKKKLPVVQYPKDCMGCLFCGLFCPTNAISVNVIKGRKIPQAI